MMLDPIKCFRLKNIRLISSNFSTVEDVGEKLIEEAECTVQTRRWVQPGFVTRETSGEQMSLLLVTVNLGLRLVDAHASANEEATPIYTLEASFVTEFEVLSTEFDNSSLDEFSTKNAAHVVWPYWRQHVASTLHAASLPALQIPLMAGIKSQDSVERVPGSTDATPVAR